jgi:nicotinic acid phosphoribosyltransferase
MLADYLEEDIHDKPAVFDLFFRQNPFQGGYAVFAGLRVCGAPIQKAVRQASKMIRCGSFLASWKHHRTILLMNGQVTVG